VTQDGRAVQNARNDDQRKQRPPRRRRPARLLWLPCRPWP
jgi:hypothetical protein